MLARHAEGVTLQNVSRYNRCRSGPYQSKGLAINSKAPKTSKAVSGRLERTRLSA